MKQVLTILVLLCLLSALMPAQQDASFWLDGAWLFSWLIPACLLLVGGYVVVHHYSVTIRATDVWLFAFFIYVLLRAVWVAGAYWHDRQMIVFCTMFLFYAAVRSIGLVYEKYGEDMLVSGLVVAGIVEAGLGLLQLYGWSRPWTNLHAVAGSFLNPGPYAGYLAALLPLAVSQVCFADDKKGRPYFIFQKYGGWILIFLSLLVLPATHSRAAWLSGIGGSAVVLLFKYPLYPAWRSFLPSVRYRFLGAVAALVILCAGAYGLYQIKRPSAQGRALMYEVSLYTWWDTPVFGVGFNRFAPAFMRHQAGYFLQHPEQERSRGTVAGYGEHAFNEYLLIAVEQGAVGLLIFLAVLVLTGWRVAQHVKSGDLVKIGCAGGLVSLLIFSFFSYPFSLPLLQMLFFFFCAILASTGRGIAVSVGRWPGWVCMLIVALVSAYAVGQQRQNQRAVARWREGLSQVSMSSYQKAVYSMAGAESRLCLNGKFFFNYGQALHLAGQHERAVVAFEKAAELYGDSYIFTGLGQCYEALGNKQKAEEAYLRARQMMPFLFYPRYLLMKLYVSTADIVKARAMAHDILEMKVKIASPAVDEMRKEASVVWHVRQHQESR